MAMLSIGYISGEETFKSLRSGIAASQLTPDFVAPALLPQYNTEGTTNFTEPLDGLLNWLYTDMPVLDLNANDQAAIINTRHTHLEELAQIVHQFQPLPSGSAEIQLVAKLREYWNNPNKVARNKVNLSALTTLLNQLMRFNLDTNAPNYHKPSFEWRDILKIQIKSKINEFLAASNAYSDEIKLWAMDAVISTASKDEAEMERDLLNSYVEKIISYASSGKLNNISYLRQTSAVANLTWYMVLNPAISDVAANKVLIMFESFMDDALRNIDAITDDKVLRNLVNSVENILIYTENKEIRGYRVRYLTLMAQILKQLLVVDYPIHRLISVIRTELATYCPETYARLQETFSSVLNNVVGIDAQDTATIPQILATEA
jgi:hypothetical protein